MFSCFKIKRSRNIIIPNSNDLLINLQNENITLYAKNKILIQNNKNMNNKVLKYKKINDDIRNSMKLNFNYYNQKIAELLCENYNLLKKIELFLNTNNIDDNYLCIICMNDLKEIICQPCNHFSLCQNCSKAINKCPLCRKDIEAKIKVFY